MKIERPDWRRDFTDSGNVYDLDKWFDQYVEPINKLLSEGVEVVMPEGYYTWCEPEQCSYIGSTKKALLINVTELQKETAEDVLNELVMAIETDCMWDANKNNLLQRAKAVLGE